MIDLCDFGISVQVINDNCTVLAIECGMHCGISSDMALYCAFEKGHSVSMCFTVSAADLQRPHLLTIGQPLLFRLSIVSSLFSDINHPKAFIRGGTFNFHKFFVLLSIRGPFFIALYALLTVKVPEAVQFHVMSSGSLAWRWVCDIRSWSRTSSICALLERTSLKSDLIEVICFAARIVIFGCRACVYKFGRS